jgi:hypothetical protein
MSRPIEALDITLLRNNKNEFVIRCQRIISIIVRHYTLTGMFSMADFEDVKQSVTLELIDRLPLIEKNYNGEVLLTTYVDVVIKNICLQIHKNESHGISAISLGEIHMQTVENSEGSLAIVHEVERFTTALKLYRSKRFKILVCLKVYFSISVRPIELRQCFPDITDEDIHRLLEVFEKQAPDEEAFSHFNLLASMMNKYEQASATETSLRHWTNIMIQKLIRLMNGDPPRRTYTKDSLRILLEHYSELHTDSN